MAICPAGHTSSADDYCDVCGLPIDSTANGAPAPIEAHAAPEAVRCPNCGTPNAPDALFCEACGYDFTTGTLPRSAAVPSSPDEPEVAEFVAEGAPVTEPDAPPAEPVDTPAAPIEPAETPADQPVEPIETPAPAEPWEAPAVPEPNPAPAGGRLLHPQPTSVDWVAEVWIDPDWYATQGSTDALPSPGLPDVVPLRATSVLIGRVSVSRNIHPDIDCDPDTGVSRRHAQISTDGPRWWIEDLESANGTFVGPSAGPLPTEPIGRGRVEFAPDQRLYVGGWTRIVIRRATDDEQQAFSQ